MANQKLAEVLERRPDFKDKYLDLDEVASQRKKNESETHFKLKYIGMFWLYDRPCRPVGLEIELPFRNHKKVVDVVGLGKRKVIGSQIKEAVYDEIDKMYEVINEMGFDDVKYDQLQMICDERDFAYLDNPYKMMTALNKSKSKTLQAMSWFLNRTEHLFYGVEAKASKADFKNGFNTFCDYTYIIAPKGVLDKKDIPKYIGLLEVDFDKVLIPFYPVPTVSSGVRVTKRATFNRDDTLLTEEGNTKPDRFESYHNGILRSLAMDNWYRSMKLLTYGGLVTDLN